MLIRSKGSASSMKPAGQTISNRLLASLAAPALPMAALTLPLIIYLPEFYANALGLDLAVVGLIFTIVRLADLFFDPFVGGLMDRSRSRWGQFRPWLIVGAPLVMRSEGHTSELQSLMR